MEIDCSKSLGLEHKNGNKHLGMTYKSSYHVYISIICINVDKNFKYIKLHSILIM